MTTIQLPDTARTLADPEALAFRLRMDPAALGSLLRGETIETSDTTAARLAVALHVELEALVVRPTRASSAPSFEASGDGCDPSYDDCAPVVMASAMNTAPAQKEQVDMVALAEQTIERLVVESEGVFTDEDLELCANVMIAGEFPSSLTPREVPAFVRAWLDAAAGLRVERNATVEALLARVIRDAPKGPVKMAQGILAKVNAAKAPAKSSKKAPKG